MTSKTDVTVKHTSKLHIQNASVIDPQVNKNALYSCLELVNWPSCCTIGSPLPNIVPLVLFHIIVGCKCLGDDDVIVDPAAAAAAAAATDAAAAHPCDDDTEETGREDGGDERLF
jgi:hypothetical protein